MDERVFHGMLACLVAGLGACGGGGDDGAGGAALPAAPATGTPPVAPSPGTPAPPAPAPSPPASAPNRAPEADAGANRSTVEEQDVVVDGAQTRDPDGDALTYRWRMVSAPAGSAVTVRADTASFVFRPDLPGTYQLELTVSDGRSEDTDTMRVVAEPLLAFRENRTLDVRGGRGKQDDRLELQLITSDLYRGGPVGFTVTTDVPWLSVARPTGSSAPAGEATSVLVEVVREELGRLENGDYEARVTVTPSGGWEQTSVTVTLRLRGSHKAVPYVAYTGQAARVTLYGEGLQEAARQGVSVDGLGILRLVGASDDSATFELPPLPAGVHRLRIDAGDSAAASVRIVVRDEPIHVDAELGLPGRARSLQYDAERDVFYGIFGEGDARTALRLRNSGTGEWVAEGMPVAAPLAVALTPDGTELLVATGDCRVHRLDPQTLTPLRSVSAPDCEAALEDLTALAAPEYGRVAIADDGRASTFVAPTGSASFTFDASGADASDYRLRVRELWQGP